MTYHDRPTIHIATDGAARGNLCYWAFQVADTGSVYSGICAPTGSRQGNSSLAELLAVYHAVRYVQRLNLRFPVEIVTDSLSTVERFYAVTTKRKLKHFWGIKGRDRSLWAYLWLAADRLDIRLDWASNDSGWTDVPDAECTRLIYGSKPKPYMVDAASPLAIR